MVDIKRYVENIKDLVLDESYKNDFMMIGSMYNIPTDVLDASFGSSTYENQEKATGRHVEYSFNPKAVDFVDGVKKKFNYNAGTTKIIYGFDHLSFMKIFEREAENARTVSINNLAVAREAGIISEEEFIARGKILFGINE